MDPTTGATATLTHFLPASLLWPKTTGKSMSSLATTVHPRTPPACSHLPPLCSLSDEAQQSPQWPRRAFWGQGYTPGLSQPHPCLSRRNPACKMGGRQGGNRTPIREGACPATRGWCLPPWHLLERGKTPDLWPGPHWGSCPIRIWRRLAAPQHRCHTARDSASGIFHPAAHPPRSLTKDTHVDCRCFSHSGGQSP